MEPVFLLKKNPKGEDLFLVVGNRGTKFALFFSKKTVFPRVCRWFSKSFPGILMVLALFDVLLFDVTIRLLYWF